MAVYDSRSSQQSALIVRVLVLYVLKGCSSSSSSGVSIRWTCTGALQPSVQCSASSSFARAFCSSKWAHGSQSLPCCHVLRASEDQRLGTRIRRPFLFAMCAGTEPAAGGCGARGRRAGRLRGAVLVLVLCCSAAATGSGHLYSPWVGSASTRVGRWPRRGRGRRAAALLRVDCFRWHAVGWRDCGLCAAREALHQFRVTWLLCQLLRSSTFFVWGSLQQSRFLTSENKFKEKIDHQFFLIFDTVYFK